MGRAPCCEKIGLKKGRWTAEEDDVLMKYIATNGEGSWRSLPKNAGLLRCGKSCRLRWINYLRSDLKRGNISPEEEDTIIKLHASLGNRWSVIAGHLSGRTDNEIKNYWNSHLSRRIQNSNPTDSNSEPFDQVSSKRKGGRLSKSARKKNIQNYGHATRKDDNVGEESKIRVKLGEVDAIETPGGTEESGSVSANSSEESSGARTVKEALNGAGKGRTSTTVGDEEAQWLDWPEMEELRLWDGANDMWAPWTWDSIETGGVVEDGCNYQLEGSLDNWVSDVL